MKVRLVFEKNVRYISHLELMRAVQRMLKRSGLPLKYSEGFNPHIVLSVAVPIPVGVCGLKEYADFELTENLPSSDILKSLKESADGGIKPDCVYIDCKKSFNTVKFAKYIIKITSQNADGIIEFLKKDEINTEKKAKGKIKTINLKEYIYEMNFEQEDGTLVVNCLLACGNEKNLNPMLIRKAILKEGLMIDVFNADRICIYDEEMKEFMN